MLVASGWSAEGVTSTVGSTREISGVAEQFCTWGGGYRELGTKRKSECMEGQEESE